MSAHAQSRKAVASIRSSRVGSQTISASRNQSQRPSGQPINSRAASLRALSTSVLMTKCQRRLVRPSSAAWARMSRSDLAVSAVTAPCVVSAISPGGMLTCGSFAIFDHGGGLRHRQRGPVNDASAARPHREFILDDGRHAPRFHIEEPNLHEARHAAEGRKVVVGGVMDALDGALTYSKGCDDFLNLRERW